MSLRAEIREAIDEVTPPAPHLEHRVTALVAGAGRKTMFRTRRGRAPWTVPLRPPLALVAAALVVALIGGLIVGGRLLRDMSAPAHTVIAPNELRQLESRPLGLPDFGTQCPISPLTNVSAHSSIPVMSGTGPVYGTQLGYGLMTSSWGTWSYLSLEVDTTSVSGPILIRGADLQTKATVVFARSPFGTPGAAGDGIPTGSVIGTDVVSGETMQLHPEVLLDLSRPYPGTPKGEWPVYKSWMGIPKAATGCIGLRIDGVAGFSEILVEST